MKKTLIVLFLSVLFLSAYSGAFAVDFGDLSIHGFVSQGYLKSSDNNYLAQTEDGTFEFNESAINFSLSPSDNLRVGVQLMSRDLGRTRNNDIYLDWAYADYRFNDAFGIRVGKVKIPMGLYNQTRDIDFLRTSILLPQSVYNENERSFVTAYNGGGVYGNFDVGQMGNIEYEVLAGTVDADKNRPSFTNVLSSLDPLRRGSQGTNQYVEMEWGSSQALRWETPLDGLRFGVSHSMAALNMGADYDAVVAIVGARVEVDTSSTIFSLEYVWGNLTLAAEYTIRDVETDIKYSGVVAATNDLEQEGYYGLVSYQINDMFELGTYYSVFYGDKDDRDGDNQPPGMDYFAWQKDWTISVKVNLLENMALKLETHFIDGAAMMYAHENPQGIEDNMILYAAKCAISF